MGAAEEWLAGGLGWNLDNNYGNCLSMEGCSLQFRWSIADGDGDGEMNDDDHDDDD